MMLIVSHKDKNRLFHYDFLGERTFSNNLIYFTEKQLT